MIRGCPIRVSTPPRTSKVTILFFRIKLGKSVEVARSKNSILDTCPHKGAIPVGGL